MPKETKIRQTQSAPGFQGEMSKKSLKRFTRFLVTIANLLGQVLGESTQTIPR